MSDTFTKKEKSAYFFGMLGQNMLYTVIGTGLNYYYQSVIFLPAIAISVIFAAAKIFDAVKDPIMGTLIDRTHTKWGKCRPYLLFSPAAVCLFSILTFINSSYSIENGTSKNVLIIAWAAVSYILWGITYTFADAPMWTLPSLMTEDEKERSRLLSFARIAGLIGSAVVIVTIIPLSQSIGNIFATRLKSNASGLHFGMIVVASALTIIGTLLFQSAGLFTRERIQKTEGQKSSIIDNFKIMWQCKPYRQLILSVFLRSPTMLLSLVQMTLFVYYYGDNGRNSYMLFLLLLDGGNMAGSIVASLITPKLIEKFEKRSLYLACSLFNAISFFLIFVVYICAPSELDKPLYLSLLFALLLAAGLWQGILSVLLSVMIADCVDYHEYHTGHRPDGVFFSGQTLMIKLSTGLSSIISGIVYAVVGFSGDGVKAINDALYLGASFKADPMFAKYRFAIFFLFSIPPAIGCFLSIQPMKKYQLTDKEHAKILSKLVKIHKDI